MIRIYGEKCSTTSTKQRVVLTFWRFSVPKMFKQQTDCNTRFISEAVTVLGDVLLYLSWPPVATGWLEQIFVLLFPLLFLYFFYSIPICLLFPTLIDWRNVSVDAEFGRAVRYGKKSRWIEGKHRPLKCVIDINCLIIYVYNTLCHDSQNWWNDSYQNRYIKRV